MRLNHLTLLVPKSIQIILQTFQFLAQFFLFSLNCFPATFFLGEISLAPHLQHLLRSSKIHQTISAFAENSQFIL